MTKCGDSNEWVSAAVHGSIAVSYAIMIVFHHTWAARLAKTYLRFIAYPVATFYHASSTIEHTQRALRGQ